MRAIYCEMKLSYRAVWLQFSRDVCNSSRDVTQLSHDVSTAIRHCFAWSNAVIVRCVQFIAQRIKVIARCVHFIAQCIKVIARCIKLSRDVWNSSRDVTHFLHNVVITNFETNGLPYVQAISFAFQHACFNFLHYILLSNVYNLLYRNPIYPWFTFWHIL